MNRFENAKQLGREAGTAAREAGMPEPNLSGEWADDPTPTSIFWDVEGCAPEDATHIEPEDIGEYIDALAEAWEIGVAETYNTEEAV